jgi:5-hydroxyisourate hydrolase
MSAITTHVLDTGLGQPAKGLRIVLEIFETTWKEIARAVTDQDGRVRDLLAEDHVLRPGFYRLRFDTASISRFFPEVPIVFHIEDAAQHYHVPLLLSPYGYSTYRGS